MQKGLRHRLPTLFHTAASKKLLTDGWAGRHISSLLWHYREGHGHQYPPIVLSYNVNLFGKEKFSRPALAFLLSMKDRAVRQTDWQEMGKRLKTYSPAFHVAKGRAWVWLSLLKSHIGRDECGSDSRSSGSRGLCWWRGWHVTHMYWKSFHLQVVTGIPRDEAFSLNWILVIVRRNFFFKISCPWKMLVVI